jgi:AraC-like DNA-binding protein
MQINPPTWLMKAAPCIRPTGGGDTVHSHTSFGKCPKDFTTPLRIIYDHELIIYRKCACVIEFEDREFLCSPDTFIIIPPGKWHSERCVKSRGGSRYWCHFDWQFQSLKEDFPVMSFATHRPRYELCHSAPGFVPIEIQYGKVLRSSRAYELASKLKRLTSSGVPHNMLLAGTTLHELLIELLDTPPRYDMDFVSGEANQFLLASRVRRMLDMVASKPPKHLKMSKVLFEFSYSYEHLCRVFKRAYGVSPLQYVHAQQIMRAKILLKDSELNVAEICFAIGMNSPAYFAKLFRTLIGKMPSYYRNDFHK